MAPRREFTINVIEQRPKVIKGKKFNYKATEGKGYYLVWLQAFEGEPWKLGILVEKTPLYKKAKWCYNFNVIGGGNQFGCFDVRFKNLEKEVQANGGQKKQKAKQNPKWNS